MTDTKTTVGVVAESGADERRVALVPKAVATLLKNGVNVIVESGAGERALLPDDLYTAAGATIGDAWAADVVLKVAPPGTGEVAKLRSGQTLVGFLAPRNTDNKIGALKAAGVQAFAVEAIPRISRAQGNCQERGISATFPSRRASLRAGSSGPANCPSSTMLVAPR